MSFSEEQLVSQYPDNVVEKFAAAFFRRSPYDGPGSCMVTYSRELTVANCYTDNDFYKPLFIGFVLFMLVSIICGSIRSACCR
jgi:hypothetical protein